MNAPVAPAAVQAASLQQIEIPQLKLSSTHIQEMRRKRFTKEKLAELAASIKSVGLLQPLVARPRGDSLYEIVAGERRVLASKLAGLAAVPCNVCDLTDEQVLEVQLIENLQREGLHELEEAEGYDELMKLKKINADAVAEMVGKSRSYVYGRTKLLALCPEARNAFYAGELDSSRAYLIARIGHHDTQRQAMKDLQGNKWDGPMSYREAHRHIVDRFMLKLKSAPFDTDDANLLPKAGSCKACPKRTGNEPDLFGDITKDADTCTDAKCFDDKRQAHYAGARKALEAKGKKVIHGDDAKKALPYWNQGDDSVGGQYIAMKDSDYVGGRHRKVADALGPDYQPILIQHPKTGKIIEAATRAAFSAAANKGGKEKKGSSYNYSAAQSRAKAKGPDVDDQLTEHLANLIHKNAPKAFGKAWLLNLAKELRDQLSMRDEDAIAKAWGWSEKAFRAGGYGRKLPTEAAKLDERGLVLLMFDMVFAVGPYTRDGVLKLFGINEKKEREFVIEERKKAQAAARVAKVVKKIEARAVKKLKKGKAKAGKNPGAKHRKANASFMKPMTPSAKLAAIVGVSAMPRTEITKKVWGYIKKNKLQDKKNIRLINADEKLKAVFGGKKQVSMFEMTKLISKQLS